MSNTRHIPMAGYPPDDSSMEQEFETKGNTPPNTNNEHFIINHIECAQTSEPGQKKPPRPWQTHGGKASFFIVIVLE